MADTRSTARRQGSHQRGRRLPGKRKNEGREQKAPASSMKRDARGPRGSPASPSPEKRQKAKRRRSNDHNPERKEKRRRGDHVAADEEFISSKPSAPGGSEDSDNCSGDDGSSNGDHDSDSEAGGSVFRGSLSQEGGGSNSSGGSSSSSSGGGSDNEKEQEISGSASDNSSDDEDGKASNSGDGSSSSSSDSSEGAKKTGEEKAGSISKAKPRPKGGGSEETKTVVAEKQVEKKSASKRSPAQKEVAISRHKKTSASPTKNEKKRTRRRSSAEEEKNNEKDKKRAEKSSAKPREKSADIKAGAGGKTKNHQGSSQDDVSDLSAAEAPAPKLREKKRRSRGRGAAAAGGEEVEKEPASTRGGKRKSDRRDPDPAAASGSGTTGTKKVVDLRGRLSPRDDPRAATQRDREDRRERYGGGRSRNDRRDERNRSSPIMERRRSSSRRPKDDERRGPKSSFAHDRRDDRDRPREQRAAESAREIGKTTRKEDLQDRRKKEEVAEVIEKKEELENEKTKNKKRHDLADLQPSAKGGREKAKAGRKVSENRKKRDSSADQKERQHSSASSDGDDGSGGRGSAHSDSGGSGSGGSGERSSASEASASISKKQRPPKKAQETKKNANDVAASRTKRAVESGKRGSDQAADDRKSRQADPIVAGPHSSSAKADRWRVGKETMTRREQRERHEKNGYHERNANRSKPEINDSPSGSAAEEEVVAGARGAGKNGKPREKVDEAEPSSSSSSSAVAVGPAACPDDAGENCKAKAAPASKVDIRASSSASGHGSSSSSGQGSSSSEDAKSKSSEKRNAKSRRSKKEASKRKGKKGSASVSPPAAPAEKKEDAKGSTKAAAAARKTNRDRPTKKRSPSRSSSSHSLSSVKKHKRKKAEKGTTRKEKEAAKRSEAEEDGEQSESPSRGAAEQSEKQKKVRVKDKDRRAAPTTAPEDAAEERRSDGEEVVKKNTSRDHRDRDARRDLRGRIPSQRSRPLEADRVDRESVMPYQGKGNHGNKGRGRGSPLCHAAVRGEPPPRRGDDRSYGDRSHGGIRGHDDPRYPRDDRSGGSYPTQRRDYRGAPSRAPDRHWRDDRRRSGDRRRDRSERRGEDLPEAADRSRTPKGRPKVILEPAKRSDDRPRNRSSSSGASRDLQAKDNKGDVDSTRPSNIKRSLEGRVEVNVREPPKFSATDLVDVDKKRDVDSVEAAFEVPAEESKVKFAFSGKAKTVAYGGAGGLEGAGEPPKKRAKMSFQTVTSSFAELAQQATRQLEETKIAAEAAGATTAIGASCLQRTASTNLSLTRTASEQPATSPDLLNDAGNRASRFAAPTSALPKQVGAANMPTGLQLQPPAASASKGEICEITPSTAATVAAKAPQLLAGAQNMNMMAQQHMNNFMSGMLPMAGAPPTSAAILPGMMGMPTQQQQQQQETSATDPAVATEKTPTSAGAISSAVCPAEAAAPAALAGTAATAATAEASAGTTAETTAATTQAEVDSSVVPSSSGASCAATPSSGVPAAAVDAATAASVPAAASDPATSTSAPAAATSAMSNMMQMMGMGTSVPGMNPMGASLWANWMQPHMGLMGQQQLNIPGWMDPVQQAAPANRRWCKVNAPQSCWAPPKPDPPRPREELLAVYQQKIALAIDWHPNNFKEQRQEATFNFMVPDQRAAEHYANNLYNPHARAPKGDHAFRNIGENMATFIEALDGVLFGDATGNVTEHGQSGTQGHGKQWDICRAQLNMNGVRLNDEAFTLFCDWLLKRRIQVSVWKLYTNVLTSVAPLVNYVKAWREFTEDSEPMRFHEFHLQKNYLSSESILELAELCLELNKTPPVRDDLRMKLPGTYKYNEMRINVENRPPRDQDHLCPIWLRIGHNDGVRADPQALVAAIDKLHLKYSGTGAPEAVCYVCHQYCTHLSCKRMQHGVCPVVHIQGLTDEHIEGDLEHPNDPTKLPNKHFGVPQKGMPGYGRYMGHQGLHGGAPAGGQLYSQLPGGHNMNAYGGAGGGMLNPGFGGGGPSGNWFGGGGGFPGWGAGAAGYGQHHAAGGYGQQHFQNVVDHSHRLHDFAVAMPNGAGGGKGQFPTPNTQKGSTSGTTPTAATGRHPEQRRQQQQADNDKIPTTTTTLSKMSEQASGATTGAAGGGAAATTGAATTGAATDAGAITVPESMTTTSNATTTAQQLDDAGEDAAQHADAAIAATEQSVKCSRPVWNNPPPSFGKAQVGAGGSSGKNGTSISSSTAPGAGGAGPPPGVIVGAPVGAASGEFLQPPGGSTTAGPAPAGAPYASSPYVSYATFAPAIANTLFEGGNMSGRGTTTGLDRIDSPTLEGEGEQLLEGPSSNAGANQEPAIFEKVAATDLEQ